MASGAISSCSSVPEPVWRDKAAALLDELSHNEASVVFPQEYQSLIESFEHGEAVIHVQKNANEADPFYILAFQKGELLKADIILLREQIAAAVKRELEEAEARERERIAREAALEKVKREEEKRIQSENAARIAAAKAAALAKEPTIPALSKYTVQRGETLPQIAGRTEVYNDAALWPILYRANRDQIRDPNHLWPGQVLAIPRHYTKEEALEARRYSSKK